MPSETNTSTKIRLLASSENARLFRNQVGTYKLADGRILSSGFGVGSPDLIGWKKTVITSEMVGRTVAVFVGIEVKAEGGKLTRKQEYWLNAIRKAGGIAGVANSDIQAKEILNHPF